MCSTQQRDQLLAAADAAGANLTTWAIAVLMDRAGKQNADAAPLVISGVVADRLRAEARKQGVTTDRLLEQQLLAGAGSPRGK